MYEAFLFMAEKKFSYNSTEKLKSRKQLQHLFTDGKTFSVFPIKILFDVNDKQETDIKTGVGVSSKNFKKAVDRNYIKRLLRETYRTEKLPLLNHLQQQQKKIALFLLYIDKKLPEYNFLNEKMQLAIKKLIASINETTS